MSVKIVVPASSANLGPGFDSLGLAVDRYLTLEVLDDEASKWRIEHDFGHKIPHDERNLIIKAALALEPKLSPKRLKVTSQIPLARGLGSSSSAIVAGLKLAQYFAQTAYTTEDLLQVATDLEGHPDNVAPALLGGLTVSVMLNGRPKSICASFPAEGLLAYIPDFELATKESRRVLPTELSYKTAVRAGSLGNALVAALLTNDLALVKELLEQDLYHEPYRQKLVPHLQLLRKLAHEVNADGTYLSGAGPTVMTLIGPAKMETLIKKARKQGLTGKFIKLEVDTLGARVEM